MATFFQILGVFFIICGGSALFSEDPDDISAGVFCLLLCAGCFFLSRYFERRSDEKYSKKQKEKLNRSRGALINDVTKINHDYMLGLSEADFLDISSSDNPLRTFTSKIPHGVPSVSSFCINMETMLNSLMEEMNLSEEKANLIYSIFLEQLVLGISDEVVEETAQNFSRHLPPQLSFLKGKINYELAALGVIENIAQQINDLSLHNSVEYIRRKRGYID